MDPVVEARAAAPCRRTLRRFAVMLEGRSSARGARPGGDATWYGPTAGEFLDDCRTVDRLVAEAVDGLRLAARRLDTQATTWSVPGDGPGPCWAADAGAQRSELHVRMQDPPRGGPLSGVQTVHP